MIMIIIIYNYLFGIISLNMIFNVLKEREQERKKKKEKGRKKKENIQSRATTMVICMMVDVLNYRST